MKAIDYYERTEKIRLSINIWVSVFSVFLIILSLLIASIVTYNITNPLNKIILKIIDISQKNFGVDIPVKGNHHLKVLEEAINKN